MSGVIRITHTLRACPQHSLRQTPARLAASEPSDIANPSLFPKLPLFAGVLITAADVMLVLVFFRSNSGRQGMLLFEIVIVALVLAVFVSFMILLDLIKPVWRDVFHGLVPSKVSQPLEQDRALTG